MADEIKKKKIDALDAATDLFDNDVFPVVQNGPSGTRVTHKASIAKLKEAIGGESYLSDLGDVYISSPEDGQVLKYDSDSGKWVNSSGGGGGQINASDVFYDSNDDDSFSADNVQDAIHQILNEGAVRFHEVLYLSPYSWDSDTHTLTASLQNKFYDDSIAIVSPAPESYDDYCELGIRAVGQGCKEITFYCKALPDPETSGEVIVNCVYWGGTEPEPDPDDDNYEENW